MSSTCICISHLLFFSVLLLLVLQQSCFHGKLSAAGWWTELTTPWKCWVCSFYWHLPRWKPLVCHWGWLQSKGLHYGMVRLPHKNEQTITVRMGRSWGYWVIWGPCEEKQKSQGREASGGVAAMALTKYSQLNSWVMQGWELLAHIQLNFKCQNSLEVILAKDSLWGTR